MSTNMSVFIEMDDGLPPFHFDDPSMIGSLTEGSFILGKDYHVFDALAGGRQMVLATAGQQGAIVPLFTPRGVPVPQSLSVAQNYFFLVIERGEFPNRHFWPGHRCVTPDVAEKWLKAGNCVESTVTQWFNAPFGNRIWKVVSEPGLYGASWLLPSEVDAAIVHHGIKLEDLPVEFAILRKAISILTTKYESNAVRLVFWFS